MFHPLSLMNKRFRRKGEGYPSIVIQLIQVTWYMVDANSREREIKVMPAWKWMCNKMKNDSLIYQELLDINGK